MMKRGGQMMNRVTGMSGIIFMFPNFFDEQQEQKQKNLFHFNFLTFYYIFLFLLLFPSSSVGFESYI